MNEHPPTTNMMFRFSENVLARFYVALAVGAFIFFLILLSLYGDRPCHDEVLFINNTHLLEKEGLSVGFLREMKDQAPGPLYQLVHLAAKPLTGLKPPGIRLVNMFLLLVLATTMYSLLRKAGNSQTAHPVAASAAVFFVPVIWQIAGLALTEMPAACCAILSFRLLYEIGGQRAGTLRWLYILASALLLGLAIVGRAPFMVLLLPYGYFIYTQVAWPARIPAIALFGMVAMAIPLPLFYIWQGLVPPHQQYIAGGLNAWHGVLAFAYAAIVALFICPTWFVVLNRKLLYLLPVAYGVLLFLNIRFFGLTYYSLGYTLARVLPARIMDYYPFLLAPLLMMLALYFVVSAAVRLWQQKNNPLQVVALVSACLLLASCAGITHLFSTRYVAQASPFLLLVFTSRFKVGLLSLIFGAIGLVIGYFSLITYLNEF